MCRTFDKEVLKVVGPLRLLIDCCKFLCIGVYLLRGDKGAPMFHGIELPEKLSCLRKQEEYKVPVIPQVLWARTYSEAWR